MCVSAHSEGCEWSLPYLKCVKYLPCGALVLEEVQAMRHSDMICQYNTLENLMVVCMYTAFLRCSPFSLPLPSLPPSFLTLPCLLTPYLTPPINGTAASPDGVGTSRAVPNVDEPPRDIPIPRLVKYLPRFLLRHRPFVHHWEHRRVIANDPTYNCRFKYTVSSVKGLRTYVRMCVHVCTYIYVCTT